MQREEIVEDINTLLKLRSYLQSIEGLELKFKVFNPGPGFDKLSRQGVLQGLESLFTLLGKQEFQKSIVDGQQRTEDTPQESNEESQIQKSV